MAAEQPWPNPVDYKIWGSMSTRLAQNVNALRQHLIDVWAGVEQSVIGDGIDQWRRCFHVYALEPEEDIDYSMWHVLVKRY